jgi:hypothetical protein
MKISQEELERHRAAERLRAQRDAASLAEDVRVAHQVGFDEGYEIGFEKGIQKAIEEAIWKAIGKGEVIGRIQLLQQLLKQPETSSTELKGLPEEELVQREEILKRQLSALKAGKGTPANNKT